MSKGIIPWKKFHEYSLNISPIERSFVREFFNNAIEEGFLKSQMDRDYNAFELGWIMGRIISPSDIGAFPIEKE